MKKALFITLFGLTGCTAYVPAQDVYYDDASTIYVTEQPSASVIYIDEPVYYTPPPLPEPYPAYIPPRPFEPAPPMRPRPPHDFRPAPNPHLDKPVPPHHRH